MNLTNKKILVTGGNGFLGKEVVRILKERGVKEIIIPRSKDCDLGILENCKKITKNIDIVIHLAAKVGGIGANMQHPGSFFYENLMMGVQLIEAARLNKVQKFVAIGTICAYPKFTSVPFKEKDLWKGYPEETNAPYGLAKKMLLVQSQAYRQEYDFNSIYLLPVNLYGPNDNFNPDSSHVIPALIKKCEDAKKNNLESIEVWGDGSASREFLYVTDAAEAIILATENYNSSEPVNVGSGQEITIKKLIEKIVKIIDFKGQIIWDKSKPNGQQEDVLIQNWQKKNSISNPKLHFKKD